MILSVSKIGHLCSPKTLHWSSLRDPEVNARFGGMHGIAAKALETTEKPIPNVTEFLPIVDVLSAAMSNVVTGTATIPDALNGAAPRRRGSCGAAAGERLTWRGPPLGRRRPPAASG
jgi:hypothetical protein